MPQISSMSKATDIYQHYQKTAKIGLKDNLENYNKIVSWNKTKHEHRLNFVIPTINKLKKEIKTILDVGCGSGLYISLLKKEGYKIKGIDFSPNQIENCKQFFGLNNKEVSVGNILNIKYLNKSFDLVISLGTHFLLGDDKSNVNKAIEELSRVSKRYILIDFSNSNFILNLNSKKPYGTIWTKKLLGKICSSNKLKIISLKKFAIRKELNWLAQSKLAGWTNLFNEYSVILLEKQK